MKYIEPVLIPIVTDMMEVFKHVGQNSIKNVDIYGNYNYQEKHFNLISDYVDPSLMSNFFDEILLPMIEDDIEACSLNLLLKLIEVKSVYHDYYIYFICKYTLDTGNIGVGDFMHLGMWLKEKHNFTYKKSAKLNYVKNIKGYYNTIIVPPMWRNNSLGNHFNRLHKEPANYFDQFDTLKKAVKHLIEGGKIYILDKRDYSWVLHCLGDDFEEVEPLIFQKKVSIKPKSKKKVKIWL